MAVYFIQNENNLSIKIGYSENVKSRLRSLRTASPDPLRLLGTIDGDQRTERSLHIEFEHCRLSGEWFSPEHELVERIADLLRKRGGGRPRNEMTDADVMQLMEDCIAVQNNLLSSSCDLKFHVHAQPAERGDRGSVRVRIHDPETYVDAVETFVSYGRADFNQLRTVIAELVAEVDEKNRLEGHYPAERNALAIEACRLSDIVNREVNRVRKARRDLDIWAHVEFDFMKRGEERIDVLVIAATAGPDGNYVGDGDDAMGFVRHGWSAEQIRDEVDKTVVRHDGYVAERKETDRWTIVATNSVSTAIDFTPYSPQFPSSSESARTER